MKFYTILFTLFIFLVNCSTSKKTNNLEMPNPEASQVLDKNIPMGQDSINALFNRKVIYKNYKAIPLVHSGKATMKVCIDRKGDVISVEYLYAESTITDEKTIAKFLKAAKGYKYTPCLECPEETCGKTSMNLSINKFK